MTCLGHDLQSTGLEEILVVFLPCSFRLLRRQTWTRFVESAILVDQGELFNDLVMESSHAVQLIISTQYYT